PAWKGMTRAHGDWSAKTAVPVGLLQQVANSANTVPPDFTPHPKIKRVLTNRANAVDTEKGIDWGNAEMLAMGTLLVEGHWVRLMGQDVERGTFSHRHAILYDYNTGKRYVP